MSDDEKRTVTIFGCRCHLGSQCSNKGGLMNKCLSMEDAERCVMHHLMKSPYHELSEQEAEGTMRHSSCIEEWEEEKTVDHQP